MPLIIPANQVGILLATWTRTSGAAAVTAGGKFRFPSPQLALLAAVLKSMKTLFPIAPELAWLCEIELLNPLRDANEQGAGSGLALLQS
jgi:hypothetical protein